jgi:hypothetical protein
MAQRLYTTVIYRHRIAGVRPWWFVHKANWLVMQVFGVLCHLCAMFSGGWFATPHKQYNLSYVTTIDETGKA